MKQVSTQSHFLRQRTTTVLVPLKQTTHPPHSSKNANDGRRKRSRKQRFASSIIRLFSSNIKHHPQKRKLIQSTESIEHSIAAQPPHALSHYFTSAQVKSFPKLSALELGDFEIPGTACDAQILSSLSDPMQRLPLRTQLLGLARAHSINWKTSF